MPNRPSPHITVPTSKRLYPHWRQKFPRLHLKFRFTAGAGDRSQGRTALMLASLFLCSLFWVNKFSHDIFLEPAAKIVVYRCREVIN